MSTEDIYLTPEESASLNKQLNDIKILTIIIGIVSLLNCIMLALEGVGIFGKTVAIILLSVLLSAFVAFGVVLVIKLVRMKKFLQYLETSSGHQDIVNNIENAIPNTNSVESPIANNEMSSQDVSIDDQVADIAITADAD